MKGLILAVLLLCSVIKCERKEIDFDLSDETTREETTLYVTQRGHTKINSYVTKPGVSICRVLDGHALVWERKSGEERCKILWTTNYEDSVIVHLFTFHRRKAVHLYFQKKTFGWVRIPASKYYAKIPTTGSLTVQGE
ncbi:signal peptide-containing protein [Theileria equi strain WA]|uniref:Signal peptide-containing protein n=1 Tax=Theileria equi strain WA TaxID=1537102 RepID=L0B0J3_THEEQ|nr:signal peptide-containing protein [Theileria equi strain WA]AFZ81013.1 signal peptide-containing protein [Theileria equi strain WA]|eukprot:XP_004830679.1 signal peptide-containing protein [Theileria equi strain WA]